MHGGRRGRHMVGGEVMGLTKCANVALTRIPHDALPRYACRTWR